MVILKDCSHFFHDEKPEETKKYLLRFLNHIDANKDAIVSQGNSEFEIKDLT